MDFRRGADPGDDLVAGVAIIVAAAGYPFRRRHLADQIGAVAREFGIERLVERGDAGARGVGVDVGPGGQRRKADRGGRAQMAEIDLM